MAEPRRSPFLPIRRDDFHALTERAERAEQHAGNLALRLNAEEQAHRKDNEHLLGRAERAEAERDEARSAYADLREASEDRIIQVENTLNLAEAEVAALRERLAEIAAADMHPTAALQRMAREALNRG